MYNEIYKLLGDYDIVYLHETWLTQTECQNIHSTETGYSGLAVCPSVDLCRLTVGCSRKKEGVAIKWNCSLE